MARVTIQSVIEREMPSAVFEALTRVLTSEDIEFIEPTLIVNFLSRMPPETISAFGRDNLLHLFRQNRSHGYYEAPPLVLIGGYNYPTHGA